MNDFISKKNLKRFKLPNKKKDILEQVKHEYEYEYEQNQCHYVNFREIINYQMEKLNN